MTTEASSHSSKMRWLLVAAVLAGLIAWSGVVVLVVVAVSIDDPVEWALCTTGAPPPMADDDHRPPALAFLEDLADEGEVMLSAADLLHVLSMAPDGGGARASIAADTLDAEIWIPCQAPERWLHLSMKGTFEVTNGRVVDADIDHLSIGPVPLGWIGERDMKEALDESLVELAAEEPLLAAFDDVWLVDDHLGLRLTEQGRTELQEWLTSQSP